MKGKGRGGSIRRAESGKADFDLESQVVQPELPTQPAAKKKQAIPGKQKKAAGKPTIISYRHTDKRKNNPEVGMVSESTDPDDGKDRWCYDPHIDPALQFDFGRAQVEKLIDDALESGDPGRMRAALEDLKRYSAPYLNWTGKAERTTLRCRYGVTARARAYRPGQHPVGGAQEAEGKARAVRTSSPICSRRRSRTCRCAMPSISTSTKRAGPTA